MFRKIVESMLNTFLGTSPREQEIVNAVRGWILFFFGVGLVIGVFLGIVFG